MRVLPEVLRGDLIGGHARKGVHALRGFGAHAAQPGGRAERMHGGGVGGAMAEAADDVQPVAKRFERASGWERIRSPSPSVAGVHLSMIAPCGT